MMKFREARKLLNEFCDSWLSGLSFDYDRGTGWWHYQCTFCGARGDARKGIEDCTLEHADDCPIARARAFMGYEKEGYD